MIPCAQLLLRRQTSLSCAASLAARLRRCTGIISRRQLHAQNFLFNRCFPRRPAVAYARLNSTSSATPTPETTAQSGQETVKPTLDETSKDTTYYGPLTSTFRRLKMFSLSSLALTFAITPFILSMETASALPLAGRIVLAGVAIGTSGVSTALISWCGGPYVTKLRWLEPESKPGEEHGRALEMTTLTLRLHERVTRVYDTAFLVPAGRPFATWELAEVFQLPSDAAALAKSEGVIPGEETIAESTDKDGKVLGRWIVKWSEDGLGRCRETGKVARHFNVHQELLDRPIR